jgi:FkbM family methyltransferase
MSKYSPKGIYSAISRRARDRYGELETAIANSDRVEKSKSRKTSYSQCGEDLILDHIFEVRDITNPSYIDIGAHHPYFLNNTAIFYARGCRGINIEPDPELFKKFVESRKHDTNLNVGIAPKAGELTFYMLDAPTLNTFSKKDAQMFEKMGQKIVNTKKIKVIPIKSVIEQYLGDKAPDFMSLDAEGMDYDILRSIDFKQFKPLVICVETVEYTTNGTGTKDAKLINLLKDNGYEPYADTKINTIFIRK